MKVPVILLNYNSSTDCRKAISLLQKQKGVEIEIIVVDNCSSHDGEQEAIKKLCHENGCTFIVAKENRGYNVGNNIGLRYAAEKGYEYALIANPDMEFPQSSYVAALVAAMEQDKEIVVCGSDIVGIDGKHQNPLKRDGNWLCSFNWVKAALKIDKLDNPFDEHYCSKICGCCLMVRMEFIKSIGFFDENVFLYCEEAILSRQVDNYGKRMYYLADIYAVHKHVKREKGDPITLFKHWQRSRIYYIKRYSGDHWLGRQLQVFNVKFYVWMYSLIRRIKNLRLH